MECTRCNKPAVVLQRYSGDHLCENHLYKSIESRIKSRIREDEILEGTERWVVGLSGGKDSTALLYILNKVFQDNPDVTLIALTLNEGIQGYRNKAVETAKALTNDLGVQHEVVDFNDEFNVTIDGVMEQQPEGKPCAYCGVFRRTALNKHAKKLNATKLLTGHNLDDVAQTALMNFLDGDVERMSRHYRASLSPVDEDGDFIRRAKPLRDIPEKEIAIYTQLKNLPVYLEECPNADGATRGEIRDLLLEYEKRHPGTRHSIIRGYERIASKLDWDAADTNPCSICGEPTLGDRCKACSMLAEVS